MSIGRQYFTVCYDDTNEMVYVIGGFNDEVGLLDTFETFSSKALKWAAGDAKINTARINASACKCGTKYIYLFGGLGKKDFLDSVERYNMQLGIWTQIQVKLPMKMSNHFSFSFSPDYLIVFGGMIKKQEAYIPRESQKVFELSDRVMVLKTKNFKWKDLKPFPFKKKFGNVIYNNHGKFFCFVIESNRDLP
mmetsp:Transcript_5397/g.6884  ORF Transcript_5397/g.6884 Transcript_5397/m.6884 type:complete len:192 (-) Transcript_5397:112-687(-)